MWSIFSSGVGIGAHSWHKFYWMKSLRKCFRLINRVKRTGLNHNLLHVVSLLRQRRRCLGRQRHRLEIESIKQFRCENCRWISSNKTQKINFTQRTLIELLKWKILIDFINFCSMKNLLEQEGFQWFWRANIWFGDIAGTILTLRWDNDFLLVVVPWPLQDVHCAVLWHTFDDVVTFDTVWHTSNSLSWDFIDLVDAVENVRKISSVKIYMESSKFRILHKFAVISCD